MSDVVERLRNPSLESPRWADTMDEAAAEIERLRAHNERLTAENSRLWGALRHLAEIVARHVGARLIVE